MLVDPLHVYVQCFIKKDLTGMSFAFAAMYMSTSCTDAIIDRNKTRKKAFKHLFTAENEARFILCNFNIRKLIHN